MKKLLSVLIILSLAAGVAVFLFFNAFYLDESKRRKLTSVEIHATDPRGVSIGFANVVFLDGNGNAIKTTMLTSDSSGGKLGEYAFEPATGKAIKPYDVDSDWGKGVASVQIEAFGCAGTGSVEVVEEKRGSGWPLSHTFHVEYTVSATIEAQPAHDSARDAAFVRHFVRFIDEGPQRTYERAYLYSVALHELQRIGTEAETALPHLVKVIEDNPAAALKEWPKKSELISALVAVGRNSSDTVPALRTILTNRELSAYYPSIISALGEMGYGTEGVMSALIASLAYDAESRALHIFAEWGDRAAPAVPAIIDLLKTTNDPVTRRSALFTLKKIGTKEALQGYQQFR